ncbi:MAG TPA: hypothetical protein DIT62_05355 [Alphaproteobacteria bacterium]|nr:hypothetical protein [Alphaproteobacteria bacterium]|tara:strand:- start:235 stop:1152 length:918 start_codon:yes stop_codon:yes gene_type:complete
MFNFRQLKAFDTVMRLGTVTAAAKALNVSQPSITRLIHELESTLGFSLFIRQGRGIISTIEARRFHQAVESAFINIEKLDELAASIRKKTVGKVSVGVIPTVSLTLLPKVLGQSSKTEGQNHIEVHVRNTPAIVDAIQLQQFDLGIVSRSPPYEGVHILYQASVNYVALIPEHHALAEPDKSLDLEKAATTEEFITFGNVYPLDMHGMAPRLAEQLQKNARYSIANLLAAASLVKETGIPAIVDPFSAQMMAEKGGVVIRPLLQSLNYHIAIITRGLDTMTRETRMLTDLLINGFQNDPIIKSHR